MYKQRRGNGGITRISWEALLLCLEKLKVISLPRSLKEVIIPFQMRLMEILQFISFAERLILLFLLHLTTADDRKTWWEWFQASWVSGLPKLKSQTYAINTAAKTCVENVTCLWGIVLEYWQLFWNWKKKKKRMKILIQLLTFCMLLVCLHLLQNCSSSW